jgi:hypothetical protein
MELKAFTRKSEAKLKNMLIEINYQNNVNSIESKTYHLFLLNTPYHLFGNGSLS